MRVKLSAKLLIIGWTLMKNKEPFNPDCPDHWVDLNEEQGAI
jgi:hypothetical protein